jgi:hypothetical protein
MQCLAGEEHWLGLCVLTEKCGAWDESAERAATSHAGCCVWSMRGGPVRVAARFHHDCRARSRLLVMLAGVGLF